MTPNPQVPPTFLDLKFPPLDIHVTAAAIMAEVSKRLSGILPPHTSMAFVPGTLGPQRTNERIGYRAEKTIYEVVCEILGAFDRQRSMALENYKIMLRAHMSEPPLRLNRTLPPELL